MQAKKALSGQLACIHVGTYWFLSVFMYIHMYICSYLASLLHPHSVQLAAMSHLDIDTTKRVVFLKSTVGYSVHKL